MRFSTRRTGHFNPLPPHGGRHAFKYLWRHEKKFQSTPSAWRETNSHCVLFWNADNFNPLPPHGGRLQKDVNNYVFRFISIHSLRMEGDNTPYIFSKASFAFQSTPSAWRETYAFAIKPHAYDVFQSTPSAWRETPVEHYFSIRNSFQSTPSAWRETRAFDDSIIAQYISIHSLRMEGD